MLRQTGHSPACGDKAIQVVRAYGYDLPANRIGYGVDRSVCRPMDRVAGHSAPAGPRWNMSVGSSRKIEKKGVDDLIQAVSPAATPVNLAITSKNRFKHSSSLKRQHSAARTGFVSCHGDRRTTRLHS